MTDIVRSSLQPAAATRILNVHQKGWISDQRKRKTPQSIIRPRSLKAYYDTTPVVELLVHKGPHNMRNTWCAHTPNYISILGVWQTRGKNQSGRPSTWMNRLQFKPHQRWTDDLPQTSISLPCVGAGHLIAWGHGVLLTLVTLAHRGSHIQGAAKDLLHADALIQNRRVMEGTDVWGNDIKSHTMAFAVTKIHRTPVLSFRSRVW